jgi:hypothetical protein
MREIPFEGSELHVMLKNHNAKTVDGLEKLQRHLEQAKIAAKEHPKARFWKDAVIFLENKLKGRKLCQSEDPTTKIGKNKK